MMDEIEMRNSSSLNDEHSEKAADSRGKGLKLVFVLFGLLCITQAALNVGLRLYLYDSSSDADTKYENVTAERDELQKMYSLLQTSHQSLSIERDELKQKVQNLKNSLSDADTKHENLKAERDELQKMCSRDSSSDADTKYENVTAERDELQKMYSLIKASNQALSEERDELKQKLQNLINYIRNEWVNFDQSMYFISTTTKSWQESREFCRQRGADLVIINSKEEQEFTTRLQKRVWIGLTDKEVEGTWKWVDGTLLNTSYWVPGEPNNYHNTNEDCGEIRFYEKENNWNDLPCREENFWICETNITLG